MESQGNYEDHFQAWKVMENSKVMESHGKVMENDDNVMEFLLLY